MFHSKAFRRLLVALRVALLLLLLVFLFVPLIPYNAAINNASLQRARSERLAKDALILEYLDTSSDDRAQAVSEMQITLPLWEGEQSALIASPDGQIALIALQSNSDYSAMTAASQSVLATPTKPADTVEVDIIVSHEHAYEVAINQIVTLMQQDIATQQLQLFIYECVVVALSLVLTLVSMRIQKGDRVTANA